MDGRRRSFAMPSDGTTVLEAAEQAGLELPYSCRAGVCSTCRTRVVRGAVTMMTNYALEPWEVEAATCCAARRCPPRRNSNSPTTSADMSYQTILFEVSDGIARLTLNRPDRLNSFNVEMHARSPRCARSQLAQDRAARVLVLTRRGPWLLRRPGSRRPCRCAGRAGRRPRRIDRASTTSRSCSRCAICRCRSSRPSTVSPPAPARTSRSSCDLVIATRSASFIQSFGKLGLVPDSGGTWLLPRLLGNARAMGLALLADKLSAEQAAQWGLIWRCVEDAEFKATVDALAQQLALAPTRGLARTKQAIYESWGRSFEQQLDQERDFQRELGRSQDYAEGVAAFTEKRNAEVRRVASRRGDHERPAGRCRSLRQRDVRAGSRLAGARHADSRDSSRLRASRDARARGHGERSQRSATAD